MSKSFLYFLVSLVLSTVSAKCFAAEPSYSITEVTVNGATMAARYNIQGEDINDLGQIVGRYLEPKEGKYYTFRTKPGSSSIDLQTDNLNAPDFFINGINNVGQVVGSACLSVKNVAICTKSNSPVNEANYLSDKESCAYAVNDSGQVVGRCIGDDKKFHAFCTKPNKPIDLKTDILGLADKESCAFSINNAGQVVGCFVGEDGNVHAFCTKPNKPFDIKTDDLGLPQSEKSCAFAINNSGQIAGYFDKENDKTHPFNFFRTKPNKPIDLETDVVLSFLSSSAGDSKKPDTFDNFIGAWRGQKDARKIYGKKINDKGQILDSEGSGYLVNDKFPVALSGLVERPPVGGFAVVDSARAINNKGQILVHSYDSSYHCFLLTPLISPLSPDFVFSRQLAKWDNIKSEWVPIKNKKDSEINTDKSTVVLTHGWRGCLDKTFAKIAGELYVQDNSANILSWNWESEARSVLNGRVVSDDDWSLLQVIYFEGLNDAQRCINDVSSGQGENLANELRALEINPEKLQLVGHSAGASLIGSAASKLSTLTGKKVKRLTVLDAPQLTLSEIPQMEVDSPSLHFGTGLTEPIQKVLVKDKSLLLTKADALFFIDPKAAYQVEIYYSGPKGSPGREALGFGAPLKGGNIFNGQIVAGAKILESANINPDHIRIVDWYANTNKAASDKNSFTVGLNWSIFSTHVGDFKTGNYKETGYDKKVFSLN